MVADEDNEIAAKRLCADCVREDYLRAKVKTHGKRRKCSYCGTTGRTFSVEEIADCVEQAFEQHYTRTPDQPNAWQEMMLRDKESDYDWEREGEPVVDAIMNAAEIPEAAAADIQSVLDDRHGSTDHSDYAEETEFSSETYYEQKAADSSAWMLEWEQFERSLKTEARFFSRAAARLLKSVFDGIDQLKTRDGRSLIVKAGPGRRWHELYRARVFQSVDSLGKALIEPDRHLGSPPSRLANAGRMNARGISVFYGAKKPQVALAEVRPPVGSQVAIARFEIIRSIKLLDLTAFDGVTMTGSLFDPDFASILDRLAFLRSISKRIARPVMPDDEPFDYLATQAVADYLATDAETPVDGIIFPTVQVAGGGLNVVLFHKAASVERIILPAGTTTSFSSGHDSDDGWETEYTVYEEVPSAPDKALFRAEDTISCPDPHGDWADRSYNPALRIDLESIYVHVIEAVTFKSSLDKVLRHRWEKRDPDDPAF